MVGEKARPFFFFFKLESSKVLNVGIRFGFVILFWVKLETVS